MVEEPIKQAHLKYQNLRNHILLLTLLQTPTSLDLPVLANLVISREGYFSFADEGLL